MNMPVKCADFTKGWDYFDEDVNCQLLKEVSALQYYEPDSLFLYSFVARSEVRDNKTPLCVQNVGLSIFSVFVYILQARWRLFDQNLRNIVHLYVGQKVTLRK